MLKIKENGLFGEITDKKIVEAGVEPLRPTIGGCNPFADFLVALESAGIGKDYLSDEFCCQLLAWLHTFVGYTEDPVRHRSVLAANRSVNAHRHHHRSARRAAGNLGEHHHIRFPFDTRRFAEVYLTACPQRRAVQFMKRINRLRKVRKQIPVTLQRRLDIVDDLFRFRVVRSDGDDEPTMTEQHRPEDRRFNQRRLAASARHRQGEFAAALNKDFL